MIFRPEPLFLKLNYIFFTHFVADKSFLVLLLVKVKLITKENAP
ncbi:hypothetical protein HDF25_002516 [Pedobacter cryoconitis]|uniref:Uncharacterized protein n=1 Tax=Pedobacter cryoconitis TaxID=188932 RepID=A0A7X0J3E4_9SPHI|nr:hypothetical protein [Pedobacter cryoconitis]